jgi:hypothetical protein
MVPVTLLAVGFFVKSLLVLHETHNPIEALPELLLALFILFLMLVVYLVHIKR